MFNSRMVRPLPSLRPIQSRQTLRLLTLSRSIPWTVCNVSTISTLFLNYSNLDSWNSWAVGFLFLFFFFFFAFCFSLLDFTRTTKIIIISDYLLRTDASTIALFPSVLWTFTTKLFSFVYCFTTSSGNLVHSFGSLFSRYNPLLFRIVYPSSCSSCK